MAPKDDRGYGWVIFAALLLLMLGTMNFIEGLAEVVPVAVELR
ncbi:MAG TPA: hypothetical protein VIX82_04970 [Solirubrobacteraceae bacterium]